MAKFDEVIENCLVCLNMTEPDGHRVVTTLIEQAVAQGLLPKVHKDEAIKAVMNREMSASTAMPDGIALPHGRTDCVTEIVCMIGIHPKGVDFGAPDNQPSHIFVLLLVPATVGCNHIHFLANLSRRLMEPSVRNDLMGAQTREQILRAILNCSDEGLVS
jgi:mannitol/fructose-specific phosphotransferase system IIA component (Ntr-type)